METIKKTVIEVKTTDGKSVSEGNTVIFLTQGRVIAGKFKGIGKRGSWIFNGIGPYSDVTYNVLPGAIKSMYLAEVNV